MLYFGPTPSDSWKGPNEARGTDTMYPKFSGRMDPWAVSSGGGGESSLETMDRKKKVRLSCYRGLAKGIRLIPMA